MGTDSLFWDQFRGYYKPVDPSELRSTNRFAVDASVFLYNASWRGLGWKTFVADPRNDDRLAEEWAEDLMQQLNFISSCNITLDHVAWFFEGKTPDKARHIKLRTGSDRKKNRALRNMAKQTSPAKQAEYQQMISSAFGRPDWNLTLKIAHKIHQRGFLVSAEQHSESDHRIARWASSIRKAGCDVVVLSKDSDYLAFSPPNSVSYMAYPIPHQRDKLNLISKSDILKEAGQSDLQMVLTFGNAGSDNIKTHIEGMGWYRSSQYVNRNIPADWNAEDFRNAQGLERLPNLIKWKNATNESVLAISEELVNKLDDFGWFAADAPFEFNLPPYPLDGQRSESYLHSFAFATEPFGEDFRLVRPRVARIVLETMSSGLSYNRQREIWCLIRKTQALQITKKRKPLFENTIDNSVKIGFHSGVRHNGVKERFGVGITAVREVPLITGPLMIPQWLASVKNSDLEKIQREKGKQDVA